jgi:hypothetical protein
VIVKLAGAAEDLLCRIGALPVSFLRSLGPFLEEWGTGAPVDGNAYCVLPGEPPGGSG